MLVRTTTVAETQDLAVALADLLRSGDLVLLTGEMGAGKTAFTQGLGRGLGVGERITSPTFTIVSTYEGGRLRLHHLDVYRLNHLHEALDVGLAEMLDDDAVVVIEWGDAVRAVLPADYLEIAITFPPMPGPADDPSATAGELAADPSVAAGDAVADPEPAAGPSAADDERHWLLRPVGARWRARADGLAATVDPWAVPAC